MESYQWFRIQTCFDTKAKCLEMAYWMDEENIAEYKEKSEIQENNNLLVKCDTEVLVRPDYCSKRFFLYSFTP